MITGYFELDKRHTNFRIEAVAGVTTFLTMAYIIFVNPSILSLEGVDVQGVETMDKQALVAATCIAAGIGTFAVGLVANAPIAMAPGMGLNAFFATLLISGKMTWQTALGAVFVSGAFFLVLTLLGLRKRLVEPRAGYVRWSLRRKRWEKRQLLMLLWMGIGAFGLGITAFIAANDGFELGSLAAGLPAILLGLPALVLGTTSGIKRLLAYGVLLVAAGLTTIAAEADPGADLLAGGAVILLVGSALWFGFVRSNPKRHG